MDILAIIAWIIIVSSMVFLSGFSSILPIVISFVAYLFIAYGLRMLFRLIFRFKPTTFLDFVRSFFRKTGIFLLATGLVLGGFCAYQNEIDPAPLSVYTLSNGTKTVVFRSMAHIGSPRFYQAVSDDVRLKKSEGYALFYEGVRPGTPENMEKFNRLLGFQFDVDLYPVMSKLYGLRYQNNSDFLGFSGGIDYNADVSIDDLISAYEKTYGPIVISSGSLVGSGATGSGLPIAEVISGSGVTHSGAALSGAISGTGKATLPSAVLAISTGATASWKTTSSALSETPSNELDIVADMEQLLNTLNPRELAVLRYCNRAMMGFVIKNGTTGLEAAISRASPGLFPVILDARNANLVREIESSKESKILVMYGALHFDGVFNLLQEHDSKWKISGPIINEYPTKN